MSLLGGFLVPLGLEGTPAGPPARAAAPSPAASALSAAGPSLVAPPAPPSARPAEPAGYRAPVVAAGTGSGLSPARLDSSVAPPPQAYTWGQGTQSTLVVYDTTNTWGYLGEEYAMAAGNLASHFGSVTAEPVVDYVPGQLDQYTATIYIGSTYNEPIPASFLSDVLATTRPVIWMGDNIWQLSGPSGSATDASFMNTYGWDAATSYFDTNDSIPTVSYNGQTLNRNTSSGSVLAPHITNSAAVSVLGSANCETQVTTTSSSGATTTSWQPVACNSLAQAPGGPSATSFPWAIRSANLTYVGEVPLSYISESDRYLAFSDLLFDALAPGAPAVHNAMVRLEDVSPGIDTPAELKSFADYLYSVHVPFSVGVIPVYTDPNGYYNNGKPLTENISQTSNSTIAAFDDALKYMAARGGTIIEHGYTHQYSNVDNPFSAVSGDDFEFFRAQCSSTQTAPYSFDAPCPNTDWVIQEGPLPNDSSSWAQGRVLTGQNLFAAAGLATPTIWETPHYSASNLDYAGMDSVYKVRYERELFFGGQITPGATIDYNHVYGQFFPYTVTDAYGETVLPEDLGNYEPTWENNNPPKPPSYIIGNAQAELAVRQGVASFFFHPYYSLTYLQQIVQGIQGLGYTFVSPQSEIPSTANPVQIQTSTALPSGRVKSAYSATLSASGGTGPYTWTLVSGSLPNGLELTSTGQISGTPAKVGTFNFTVQATDSTPGGAGSDLRMFTLSVTRN